MKNSSTYQAILREGEEIGEARGEARGQLRFGRRLGEPDAATLAAIEALDDVEKLEQLALQTLEVESWGDLLSKG